MKLPWMKLWFEDLDRDCGALSLAARGGWMWIIGDLHCHAGERSLSLDQWARVMRTSTNQAASVLAEIINTNICDSNVAAAVTQNVTRNALSQESNALITIKCRRMARESNQLKQNSLRQQHYRDRHGSNGNSNGDVTPKKQKQKQKTTPQTPQGGLSVSDCFSGNGKRTRCKHDLVGMSENDRNQHFATCSYIHRPGTL